MTNRSDDEMPKDLSDSLVRLDEPSDLQDTQDEAPSSSPAPQQQISEQHQQMINKLRVQMLEAQKVCAAALASTAVATTSSNSTASIEDGRYCWVCFATDEDDKMAAWVQPCKCSGTTKWVHQVNKHKLTVCNAPNSILTALGLSIFFLSLQNCLQRWVDEKQKGNAFKRVNCPQCRTEYIIVFPEMGTFVSILEGIDSIIKRLSPFLAAGVIVGSLYWTAVTYGAVTVCTYCNKMPLK